MDEPHTPTTGYLQRMANKGNGRGFAGMSPERRTEIASMGGKAAHAQGKAHLWTPEEARAAGIKGGQASRKKRYEDQD